MSCECSLLGLYKVLPSLFIQYPIRLQPCGLFALAISGEKRVMTHRLEPEDGRDILHVPMYSSFILVIVPSMKRQSQLNMTAAIDVLWPITDEMDDRFYPAQLLSLLVTHQVSLRRRT